jgi:hypothetical protein
MSRRVGLIAAPSFLLDMPVQTPLNGAGDRTYT